jgi:DnaJ-class molecular chaperone
MEDIFALAQQMASQIPDSDKKKLQGLDMNEMMSSIFSNVMKTVQNQNQPELKTLENKKKKHIEEESNESADEIHERSEDLHYNLNVKLEDIYCGKEKKISYRRKRFEVVKDSKGKKTHKMIEEKKKIVIKILPGTVDGHKIYFRGEADHLPGKEPGDVIITICEEEHDTFDREGDNLVVLKNISISEIYSLEYSFTHMDEKEVVVKSVVNDVLHTFDGVRKIVGEGMPIFDESLPDKLEYGDLFVRFNLVLPDKLTPEQIMILKDITPPINVNTLPDSKEIKLLEQVTEEDISKLDQDSDDSEGDSDDSEGDSDDSEGDSDDSEEESEGDSEEESE